jgi:hypothetical protein
LISFKFYVQDQKDSRNVFLNLHSFDDHSFDELIGFEEKNDTFDLFVEG